MRTLLILLMTALLFCAATADAQPRGQFAARMADRAAERAEQRRAEIEARMNLTPEQKQRWDQMRFDHREAVVNAFAEIDVAIADTKEQLNTGQVNMREFHERELALSERLISLHRQLKEDRLRFYESLSPAQQAEIHALMLEQIQRYESFRDLLIELAITAS